MKCSHLGCRLPRFRDELCDVHYLRRLRGGPMDGPIGRVDRAVEEKHLCAFEGCRRSRYVRGLCEKHYLRDWRRRRREDGRRNLRRCTVPGCENPHDAQGYCSGHRGRIRRGVPVGTGPTRAYGQSCTVPGCQRPHSANGLCSTHLSRRRRGKDIFAPVRIKNGDQGCSVEGCDRQHLSRGLCRMHYQRKARAGEFA